MRQGAASVPRPMPWSPLPLRHLMYGAITQINYGDTKHTTIASRRVPKFSLNQENDLRKTILKARPLAAPHNYCPWIRVKNVVG